MELLTSGLGLDLLVQTLLKGSLLAVFLLALGGLLRSGSPGTRAWLWTVGGLALLCLPFASFELPGWGSGLVPFPTGLAEAPAESLPVATWLLLGWSAGALFFAGRFAIDLGRAFRATREAEPCREERPLALLERLRVEMGIRRRVRLRLSADRTGPLTWGWLRPVVLLPREALSWPEARLRAVLHHELAHVRRHDFVHLFVHELARVVNWPNPLVWILLRQVRRDRELACDAAVVGEGMSAPEYAHQLVEVARFRLSARHPSRMVLPVTRRDTLRSRIRFVMEEAETAGRRGHRLRSLACALLLATVFVPLAGTNLWSCSAGTSAGPGSATASPTAPGVSAAAPAAVDGGPDPRSPSASPS